MEGCKGLIFLQPSSVFKDLRVQSRDLILTHQNHRQGSAFSFSPRYSAEEEEDKEEGG